MTPTAIRQLSVDGSTFLCPEPLLTDAISVLQGRYVARITDVPRPRRVLDLGAGVGAFAVWAWKHWGCWVDAWEGRPAFAELLAKNLPPGAVAIDRLPDEDEMRRYDLVHCVTAAPVDRAWPHFEIADMVVGYK